ncbi:MAG TPA: hypothetical protein VLC98_07005 [Phnomibacter sp.]|nr:hypothetical protein [Phnomibacter sp.]
MHTSYYPSNNGSRQVQVKVDSVQQHSTRHAAFVSSSIFLMMMILYVQAHAQTTMPLSAIKQEGKKELQNIQVPAKTGTNQEKQSGDMFEYLSMPKQAQTGTQGGFIAEPLPVVFTTVDTEPIWAGNAEQWQKILKGYGASVTSGEEAASKNSVTISYLVDALGDICDLQPVQPANLQQAQQAIAIMKSVGKSKPAMANGQAVAYRGTMQISFE